MSILSKKAPVNKCVHWSFDKIGGVIHILGVIHIFKYQSTLHSNIDMKKGSRTHPTPLGIVRRRPPQFCSILCHIKWLLCKYLLHQFLIMSLQHFILQRIRNQLKCSFPIIFFVEIFITNLLNQL